MDGLANPAGRMVLISFTIVVFAVIMYIFWELYMSLIGE